MDHGQGQVRLCAFIPVRGGSKGIPRKNLKSFLGKPLTQWAIEAAIQAETVETVVVSTDDAELAALADSARSPKVAVHHRSAHSARDDASTEEVMLEFTREDRAHDHILLIQATTPILSGALIDEAVRHYEASGADSLLSAVPMHRFFWRDGSEGARPLNYDPADRARRQDHAGCYYCENGALYLTRVKLLLSEKYRCPGRVTLFPMDPRYIWELDEAADWGIAETLQRPMAAQLRSRRLGKIELLAIDLDGVLTNGCMIYVAGAPGISKAFFTRDAFGIRKARNRGLKVAVITTDDSEVNGQRAERIGLDAFIIEKHDKAAALAKLASRFGLTLAQCAFLGDDDVDIDAMRAAGVSLAPADAATSAAAAADIVLSASGGRGCVREACEILLEARAALAGGE
jgi:N-acylneuraminate cytidylyltransferase